LRLVVGSFPSPVSNDEEAKWAGIGFIDSRAFKALELSWYFYTHTHTNNNTTEENWNP
jgi:hypothetical protein